MIFPLIKMVSPFAIKLSMLWLIMVIARIDNGINGAVLNREKNGILIALPLVPILPMGVLFTLGKRIIFAFLLASLVVVLSGKNVINVVLLLNALIKDLRKIIF